MPQLVLLAIVAVLVLSAFRRVFSPPFYQAPQGQQAPPQVQF